MITSVSNDRCFAYRGLSSDTKPTSGVGNGSTFFEMDTSKSFMFNGATNTWVECTLPGGGGSYTVTVM